MTERQRQVLRTLDAGPETAENVSLNFAFPTGPGNYFLTRSAAHASLRRMEDRGWVRRAGTRAGAIRWELTSTGRHEAGL